MLKDSFRLLQSMNFVVSFFLLTVSLLYYPYLWNISLQFHWKIQKYSHLLQEFRFCKMPWYKMVVPTVLYLLTKYFFFLADHKVDKAAGKKPTTASNEGPSLMESSGYNPKRQEFDPEYDHDAEQLLAEMEFKEADTEEERELKLRVLRIYSKR